MTDTIITRIIGVLLECLKDDNVEVRQMAAKTLAGLLRCSKRDKILELKVSPLFVCHHGPMLMLHTRIDLCVLSSAPSFRIARIQVTAKQFECCIQRFLDFAV